MKVANICPLEMYLSAPWSSTVWRTRNREDEIYGVLLQEGREERLQERGNLVTSDFHTVNSINVPHWNQESTSTQCLVRMEALPHGRERHRDNNTGQLKQMICLMSGDGSVRRLFG